MQNCVNEASRCHWKDWGKFMKSIFSIFAIYLLSQTAAYAGQPSKESASGITAFGSMMGEYEIAAVTCFKSGERTSGMNKICYYDCLSSEAAITVNSYDLCPLSIRN